MRDFDWYAMWAPQWSPWEVALRAAVIYTAVQVLVRVTGRKELSRYATYDVVLLFLITPALRQTIVGTDTSLTNGLVALTTLFALDWALSYVSARWSRMADLTQGKVRTLVRNGEILEDMLRRYRISKSQLLAQVRQHNRMSLDDVEDAYLERSGQISVIFRDAGRTGSR